MKLLFPIVGVLSGMLWAGCDVVNPSEPVPTFVHIDSFQFIKTPGTGSASHKISAAWVYYNNATVGIFDLPATFPVIAGQPGVLRVVPGITYSGLQDFRTAYPYYTSDTINITPTPGQVINFTPKTGYFADSTFNHHEENFEDGNSFIKLDGDTTLVRSNLSPYVFEGGWSGYIFMKAPQTVSENISTYAFTSGSAGFLEMDYKCSVPFGVGLQTTYQGQDIVLYILTLRPKADWNHVYIGIQDFVNNYPNLPYRVVIKAVMDNQAEGFVALDNLKIISSK